MKHYWILFLAPFFFSALPDSEAMGKKPQRPPVSDRGPSQWINDDPTFDRQLEKTKAAIEWCMNNSTRLNITISACAKKYLPAYQYGGKKYPRGFVMTYGGGTMLSAQESLAIGQRWAAERCQSGRATLIRKEVGPLRRARLRDCKTVEGSEYCRDGGRLDTRWVHGTYRCQ